MADEPITLLQAGRRAGRSFMASVAGVLRGQTTSAVYMDQVSWVRMPPPHPKKVRRHRRRNNPRPNRRRKAQKLRAANQRLTWYQHVVGEDHG